jgi:peptidoglycan/LPS O-acetylase OafA/YrhL
VVVFHRTGPGGTLYSFFAGSPQPIFAVVRTAYASVGVFFVLSGFVLSYNYSLDSRWSKQQLTRFARARFARIYPAYLLGLLMISPLVVTELLENFSAAELARQGVRAGLNFTLLQAWTPKLALTWNAPGWSLSNEAFFYLCFPLIGVPLWRLSRGPAILAAAIAIWIVMMFAPLAAVLGPVQGFGNVPATTWEPAGDVFWINLIKFNPLLRLAEFAMGILVGRAYLLMRASSHWLVGRGALLYIPAILLMIVVLGFSDTIPYPVIHNGLLLPLSALMILGFALGGGVVARILSHPALVFLGGASYSMYILHMPIWKWMRIAANFVFGREITGPGGMAVYVAMVVVLSSLVFKKVEEPLCRMMKPQKTRTLSAPAVQFASSSSVLR